MPEGTFILINLSMTARYFVLYAVGRMAKEKQEEAVELIKKMEENNEIRHNT